MIVGVKDIPASQKNIQKFGTKDYFEAIKGKKVLFEVMVLLNNKLFMSKPQPLVLAILEDEFIISTPLLTRIPFDLIQDMYFNVYTSSNIKITLKDGRIFKVSWANPINKYFINRNVNVTLILFREMYKAWKKEYPDKLNRKQNFLRIGINIAILLIYLLFVFSNKYHFDLNDLKDGLFNNQIEDSAVVPAGYLEYINYDNYIKSFIYPNYWVSYLENDSMIFYNPTEREGVFINFLFIEDEFNLDQYISDLEEFLTDTNDTFEVFSTDNKIINNYNVSVVDLKGIIGEDEEITYMNAYIVFPWNTYNDDYYEFIFYSDDPIIESEKMRNENIIEHFYVVD